MAVYTQISPEQVAAFLERYDLGAYKAHEGIVKGVSNSNFHLFTDKGRFILTLFEKRRINYDELPFFFAFARHLAENGITCPQALADRRGNSIGELADRAAVVLDYLEGQDVEPADLTPEHCAQAGEWLARMHVAGDSFAQERANSMGPDKWPALAEKARDYDARFMPAIHEFLMGELDYLKVNWPLEMPRGTVHADYFPDNVFFRDGSIAAVIDFYFSCTEFFSYDLAVSLNAWCFDEHAVFSPERFTAMMQAYQKVRPLLPEEKAALQVLCRGAAFRILLSRLEEFYEHDESTLMQPHDPGAYLSRLLFHQEVDVGELL